MVIFPNPGLALVNPRNINVLLRRTTRKCPKCNGRGFIYDNKSFFSGASQCKICNGRGFRYKY